MKFSLHLESGDSPSPNFIILCLTVIAVVVVIAVTVVALTII
jgi:hypothetical protein